MPVRALSEYLDQQQVDYHAYNHPPAITAQEIAESAHVPGARLAKTVIVKSESALDMAVLAADQRINLELLRDIIGCQSAQIASENAFQDQFPQCELGGMPPLGGLYNMKVYMDRSLLKYDWIAFNAGTHTEIIKMDTGVFKRLVRPTLGSFSDKIN